MDYSKKDGGTRILDQARARTLGTGMGQTIASAEHQGSHRARKVAEGIKPGQIVHDRTLARLAKEKDSDEAKMAQGHMDPVIPGTDAPRMPFPLSSGSVSHNAAGTMKQRTIVDQGESKPVPTTGRDRSMGCTPSPLLAPKRR